MIDKIKIKLIALFWGTEVSINANGLEPQLEEFMLKILEAVEVSLSE